DLAAQASADGSTMMRTCRHLLLFVSFAAHHASAMPSDSDRARSLQAEHDDAVRRVQEIVNQSVPALPITPDSEPALFQPGWFHSGANRPSFDTVDVRATQVFPYEKWEYVTSDIT